MSAPPLSRLPRDGRPLDRDYEPHQLRDGQRQNAEHQVAEHLVVTAHTHESAAVAVFESPVDALGGATCKSAPEFDPPVISLFKAVRRRSASGPHAETHVNSVSAVSNVSEPSRLTAQSPSAPAMRLRSVSAAAAGEGGAICSMRTPQRSNASRRVRHPAGSVSRELTNATDRRRTLAPAARALMAALSRC
jgi:hypothetical protein